jgi:hypothetical protein
VDKTLFQATQPTLVDLVGHVISMMITTLPVFTPLLLEIIPQSGTLQLANHTMIAR